MISSNRDHVTPPASYLATVEEKLSKQRETRLTLEEQGEFAASSSPCPPRFTLIPSF